MHYTYVQIGLRRIQQDRHAELFLGLLVVVQHLERPSQQGARLNTVRVAVQDGVGILHDIVVLLQLEVGQGAAVLAPQLELAGRPAAVVVFPDGLSEVYIARF